MGWGASEADLVTGGFGEHFPVDKVGFIIARQDRGAMPIGSALPQESWKHPGPQVEDFAEEPSECH